MKERPILFSTPMITAILEGRKTQTRRVVKIPTGFKSVTGIGFSAFTPEGAWASVRGFDATPIHYESFIKIPYGDTGDRLWVRETWARVCYDPYGTCDGTNCPYCKYVYKADDPKSKYPGEWPKDFQPHEVPVKWKPSIHIPRKAARIILEIESIRVERLHDISREDAISEGVFYQEGFGYVVGNDGRHFHFSDPRISFAKLWCEVNSPESWDANPFVWVITFKKIEPCP
jgi:glutaredoxin